MEDRSKEDHLIKIHLEDHHRIHLLDCMDGKHMTQGYLWHRDTNRFRFHLNQPIAISKASISHICEDTHPDVHIIIFKKVSRANGEIVEVDIINLFGFNLWDRIS
jgi:hypothetical protein